MEITKHLIEDILAKAAACERLRINYDLRTSDEDSSQQMLNALMPGTKVLLHRHPTSNENVFLLLGKLVFVMCDSEGNEIGRDLLDLSSGNYGCIVPAGVWHTVEVLEPSVIFEAKDGRYGKDGSENFK